MIAADDPEVDQYLETALWSSNDESDERGGEPLDRNYGPLDVVHEDRERAASDLSRFREQAQSVLDALERAGVEFSFEDESWPHDFWLTRNGHGTGFWDKEDKYGAAAEPLAALAKEFGEVHVYVGDDGMVHFG